MAASLPPKPGMAGMPPQQPHLPPMSAPGQGQQAMPPQGALKEISPVFLCRIGQETVQDIVTRTMEIFQITRATQVLNSCMLDCQLTVNIFFYRFVCRHQCRYLFSVGKVDCVTLLSERIADLPVTCL